MAVIYCHMKKNNDMNTILKSSPVREFSYFTLAFAFIGSILLMTLKKGDFVLIVNACSNAQLDYFFRNYTCLGLGVVLAIMSVLLLFVKYYYSLLTVICLAVAGLFTFLFKQVLFLHMPRPTKYFEHFEGLRIVEGVHFHSWCSFPSGHTMTAFAGATILTLMSKNKGLGSIAFILAVLVALSRIYLLQHFFMDVYAGALIGITYTFLLHLWLKRYENTLNQNLIIKLLQSRKLKKEKLAKPQPSLN